MQYIFNITFLFMILILQGCKNKKIEVISAPAKNYAEIVGLKESFNNMLNLERDGLDFVQYGEEVRVIIPTDKLFENKSTKNTKSLQDITKSIVELVNQWPIHSLEVASFDDTDNKKDSVLATQRGQIIVSWLNVYGIDVPLVYSKSYVKKNAKLNCKKNDDAGISRIEFIFNPIYREHKDCLSYAQAGIIGY